ncbi:Ribosomal RNA large subunit methyltransferase I [Thalassocella blandensis]|nr:Ribosomal RNA large subunit methyltransferase I [Thalassocella blandensis]
MPDIKIVIEQVQSKLEELLAQPNAIQQSRRWFHGRGKSYPQWEWCCIDYFSPVVIVIFYQEPPAGVEADLLQHLVASIEHFNDAFSSGVSSDTKPVQALTIQRRYLPGAPFECPWGVQPETLLARRGDLTFQLNFTSQNVGYFLDIEQARCWLEQQVSMLSEQGNNVRVLNLFAYTCAFSVVAKAAGASSVVNIDLSRRSLSIGRENHHISRVSTEDVHFFAHDIFKSWGKLKKYGPYDIVIIDPPSFQKGSFVAAKDYARLLTRMQSLVTERGMFLACLNSPEVLMQDFKQEIETICPEFQFHSILPENADFPEAEEGRALKLLVYKK